MSNLYTEQPESDDCIITKAEFIECCQSGGFIDYDGFGHPMKENLINIDENIYPSDYRDFINHDCTHVVWYNR